MAKNTGFIALAMALMVVLSCMAAGSAFGAYSVDSYGNLTIESAMNWPGDVTDPSDVTRSYGQVHVKADLTMDSNAVGITNTGAIFIGSGSSVSTPVSVTISGGAEWWPASKQTVYFGKDGGAAGTIDLTSSRTYSYAWDNSEATFGLSSIVELSSDANVQGSIDLLRAHGTSRFFVRQIANRKAGATARIVFDGGCHWVQTISSNDPFYYAGPDSVIELVAPAGKEIHFATYGFSQLSDGTRPLAGGDGVVRTAGDGGFRAELLWKTSPDILSVGDSFKFGHKGSTRFGSSNGGTILLTKSDLFPYGTGYSGVSLIGGNNIDYPMQIDLNGTTQTVNGLVRESGSYAFITNSSSAVAHLRYHCETNISISGLFPSIALGTPQSGKLSVLEPSKISFEKTGGGTLSLGSSRDFDITVLEGDFNGASVWATSYQTYPGTIILGSGATGILWKDWWNQNRPNCGAKLGGFAVNAEGELPAVITNTICAALEVRGGVAKVVNFPNCCPVADRANRTAMSRIDRVDVCAGGTLDVAAGRLEATNITAAAGGLIHVEPQARIDLYTGQPVNYKFYRFTFMESLQHGVLLTELHPLTVDATQAFAKITDSSAAVYVNVTSGIESATQLSPGQYFFSCPNGVTYVEGKTSEASSITYSSQGLSKAPNNYDYDGVYINRRVTLDPSDSQTWVTLTIRMLESGEDAKDMVGYRMRCNWSSGDSFPTKWIVEGSNDGTNWTLIDDRRETGRAYTWSSVASSGDGAEGYNWVNGGEPFRWNRGAPSGVSFDCDASVQVDAGGTLDVTAASSGRDVLAKLTVDRTVGGGTIRGATLAANGTLDIVSSSEPMRGFTLPFKLHGVEGVANLLNWRVTVNGEERTREIWAEYDPAAELLRVHVQTGFVMSFK